MENLNAKYLVKNLSTGERATVSSKAMERLLGVERSYVDWAIEQDGLFANPKWEVRQLNVGMLKLQFDHKGNETNAYNLRLF